MHLRRKLYSFLVFLTAAVQSSGAQSCPVSGCNGCGSTVVVCSFAGLTSFPQLPLDVQQGTEELQLNDNSLTVLNAGVLENYTNLTVLDLIGNSLAALPEGLFVNNTQLQHLYLGDNPLQCDCELRWLPTFLMYSLLFTDNATCGSPERLDGSVITTLAEDQFVCGDATALQSSGTQECPVPGCTGCGSTVVDCSYAYDRTTFPQLPLDVQQTVEELNIALNSISSLHASDLQNYTNLTILDLHTNELTELPENLFAANTKLKVLDLCDNSLSELPENLFAANTQLQTLNLSSNSLTTLPENLFAANTQLQTLQLVGNSLTEVPEKLFFANTQLTYLSLSGNSLTELPANVFAANVQLESLMMNSNSLAELSHDVFATNTNLGIIGMCCNSLIGLPEGVFDANTALVYVNLNSNPVECDCALRWLPTFLESRSSLLLSGTCANLNGAAINSLTEDQLICDCVPTCVNGTCNLTVGICEYGDGNTTVNCTTATACAPGTWGAEYLQNCTCLTEHESSACDVVNGSCHCLPGYTGVDCELGCPKGMYGQDCLEVCQCQNNASCDFTSGTCNCTAGWRGSLCNISCPEGMHGQDCLEVCQCQNNASCDFITGMCTCIAGWTGSFCDMGCPDGLYGQDCLEECQCQNNTSCDPIAGLCTCSAGWTGQFCNKSCTPGTWGTDCIQNCSCLTEQESSACDVTDGTCPDCLSGFTGMKCDSLETVSAKGSSLIYIGSAAGVTGVILALSVIAAAVWLTYKKHGRSVFVTVPTVVTNHVVEELTSVLDSNTDEKSLNGIVAHSNHSPLHEGGLIGVGNTLPSAQDIIARSEGLVYNDKGNDQLNSNSTAFDRIHANAVQLYSDPLELTASHTQTAQQIVANPERGVDHFEHDITTATAFEILQAEAEELYASQPSELPARKAITCTPQQVISDLEGYPYHYDDDESVASESSVQTERAPARGVPDIARVLSAPTVTREHLTDPLKVSVAQGSEGSNPPEDTLHYPYHPISQSAIDRILELSDKYFDDT